MAEALALTCLGNIAEGFLGKVGEYLFAPIQRQLKYMCCFNSNITELETQLNKLKTTREDVQKGVEENRTKVRVIGRTVKDWQTSAYKVTTEAEGIFEDKDKVKEGCLNGWCPNLKLRYSLSRKAVKKTKVVVDLNADGAQYTHSSYSPPPACLETITNRDFRGFESRRLIMEEIIKALKHDEINLIGVCGMGGVGKTTMVNEVATRAKDDNLFDEFPFAVVSQEPNLSNVQACIADTLGLKNICGMESPTARADLLRKRLLQDNKKVLLILDDIWEEFDLQAMGIPLEGANKNFKVLYTSRTRDLWHDLRTKKEIYLEILSKDEAWQLFREKAGDSVDTPDLTPIAKQIVEECGCLPLALVLIGSALSKKSGRNAIKEIWEGMLDRLTSATSTLVDEHLYSRLELSYECLEEKEAKHLFLLCCLFQEDEDISIEDLARYGLGLSLFDGINEMKKVRRQVFLIVDELKSRYLLLDNEEEEKEYVKVHDVVRDMGISIASKNKFALVIHGEVSEWPKKDRYEHYTSISLISRIITELPKGLTCPNLEFLLLDCKELEELPCNFFEGMGKLKVLVLNNFAGILSLPSSLENLHTLSLPNFHGKLDNVSEFGGLFSLKTLSFCNSRMEELPEEIGKLVDLRLLDLTGNERLKRLPPNVISRLVHLEELYIGRQFEDRGVPFKDWEGEGKEGGRNANLRELEFLSNLNTLEILIRSYVLIPTVRIFSKLKIYKVIIEMDDDDKKRDDRICDRPWDRTRDAELKDERYNLFHKCERVFMVESSIPIPSNRGGIDSLLRSSDFLILEGKGCNDLVQALLSWDGVDGLQQLKLLRIGGCDTPECLANTMNPVHLPIAHAPAIFPILKVLDLLWLVKLREICSGPVPARSFGELTFIRVRDCRRLRNLFQLPIVGCLPQLKHLIISSCRKMEEVFWKDQQEDVYAATNRIEFPKLEVLKLEKLRSLVGFCRGIDQIDFPQLKELYLEDIPRVNLLFHNNGNLSLFPEKVSLPNLEALHVNKLKNLERLGHRPLLVGSFSKLNKIFLHDCGKLLCVIPSQFLPMLRELQELKHLIISSCRSMEEVFWKDQQEDVRAASNRIEFPKLEVLKLVKLPSLVGFCRGIDQIDFPQLKTLYLEDIPQVNLLFHNNGNLSSNSKRNDNFDFLSLFPKKVSLPNLEVLWVKKLENLERLGQCPLLVGSFSKLYKLEVIDCGKLLCVIPSQFLLMLRELQELTVESCHSLEVVFELEGLDSNEPNPEILSPLRFVKLRDLPKLNCISKSDPWGIKYIQALDIHDCNSLRYVFAPTMTKSIPELRKLEISSCEMLSKIVTEENGLGERSVDEVEFPQLESLQLSNLPNLVSFFPIVNTTTLKKSTDHLHNPMQPQPFFNEKVAILCLEHLVRDLWGRELPTSSFSNLKNVKVAGCPSLRNVPSTSTQGLQEVAQLLYTDIGKGLLALGSNGTMTLWKWHASQRNPSGMATTSVLPQQWELPNGLAMTNDVTSVNLEEAVPCMALSKNESYIISACGGKVSLFNIQTFRVLTTFMPPPPASTFLAFYPQDNNIIAIGMEDSTIHIYNVRVDELKSELKGHEKRITGLAFSTELNKLVSSGADGQLCFWSTDTWEKLKSVPIQLPAGTTCNGDTRVLFHSDQIRLLVSHETQFAIYDASEMDCIHQWVPRDVLSAPISFAAYSCDSQLVYTSFCDGNIGVFDADSLTLTHRIAPSVYSPTLASGSHAVYPLVVATHPQKPNQFSIGLTNGSVIIMEPQESEGKWGLSSNTSNHALDQNQRKEEEELDEDEDEEDQEEKRKRKEKGKAPQSR